VQYANGVVDPRVPDEAAAVNAARRYLSYFRRGAVASGGTIDGEEGTDAGALRELIPANRKRVYDVRQVIDALLVDVLELRAGSRSPPPTSAARASTWRPTSRPPT
jgi:acetyl-CoA carboxylase carboxyltransferase component